METRITKLLGIKYPVIQGGMAWVATHELASAVSNAGGLGIIGAGGAPASWVKEQIVAAKKETDKPFGVNLMLMNPEADEIAKIIAEEKVKVVTTGAGNPAKYMDMWKEAGVIVIPVVASVALAKLMERGGASAVIAEGMESGGHIGAQTTMTLVPQVVDAVSIPVIAAGGIADNRGFNAAFALGAEAVQMGTRFVTAKESIVHENYKQKVNLPRCPAPPTQQPRRCGHSETGWAPRSGCGCADRPQSHPPRASSRPAGCSLPSDRAPRSDLCLPAAFLPGGRPAPK